MTDTWSEAVNNFTYYPDRNSSGGAFLSYVGGWGDETRQKEMALAACAAQDACWGVLGVHPGDKPGAGGWSYYLLQGTKGNDGGPEPGVSRNNLGRGRRTWIKKGGTRKPQDFVDGMGILPNNGDTKVKICQDSNGNTGCAQVGRGFWPRNMPNAGGANSVVVPFGYKVGLNLNFFDGLDEADSRGDGSRVGTCGGLDAGPNGNKVWNESNQDGACFKNGWNPGNRPDGILISQVPINLDDDNIFNTLTNKGVGSNDADVMKRQYCNVDRNMNNPKCGPYVRGCPAASATCYSRATDLSCPAGYDTKDLNMNKCIGYTLQNVAQVNCPTGFTKAAGNSAMCAPTTDCVIAPGYQGAGGAC